MKQGLTEIVCVVDKSGSMQSIVKDAIGGFNAFLEGQRKVEGEANFTLAFFDTGYTKIHDGVNVKNVEPLNELSYFPSGGTALYDAVGKTIIAVGKRLSDIPENERPEKIIFAILTDGEENSSHEFNQTQIFDMIKHQKEIYSWEFIFLAANQDAFATAQGLNISSNNTLNFMATGEGVNAAYSKCSLAVTNYRVHGTTGDWTTTNEASASLSN